MTAMPAATHTTAEELLVLPEAELRWAELIGGGLAIFRRSNPDAPAYDVALELERADTLTSPVLPGFAPKLDAVFGE